MSVASEVLPAPADCPGTPAKKHRHAAECCGPAAAPCPPLPAPLPCKTRCRIGGWGGWCRRMGGWCRPYLVPIFSAMRLSHWLPSPPDSGGWRKTWENMGGTIRQIAADGGKHGKTWAAPFVTVRKHGRHHPSHHPSRKRQKTWAAPSVEKTWAAPSVGTIRRQAAPSVTVSHPSIRHPSVAQSPCHPSSVTASKRGRQFSVKTGAVSAVDSGQRRAGFPLTPDPYSPKQVWGRGEPG